MTPAGFPHSDIRGSKHASCSPRRFAGCCVLLRLSVPRHPPCALSNLPLLCSSRVSFLLLPRDSHRLFLLRYSCARAHLFAFFFLARTIPSRHHDSIASHETCSLEICLIFFNLFSFQRTLCYTWAGVDLNHRPHAYQACALTS